MRELELFQDEDGIVVNGIRFCPEIFKLFADAAALGTVFRFARIMGGAVTIEVIAGPADRAKPN